jgi:ABC-type multidrug transport system permease subunit
MSEFLKKNNPPKLPANDSEAPPRKLGTAGWIAIAALVVLLIGAIFYAIHSWNAVAGTSIPPIGWLFMALGTIFTLLLGGGLMALLFYSSRKGKDF